MKIVRGSPGDRPCPHLLQVRTGPVARRTAHDLHGGAQRLERQVIERGQGAAAADKQIQAAELAEAQRRLHLVHPVIETQFDLLVGPGVGFARTVQRQFQVAEQGRITRDAMVGEAAHAFGQGGIARGGHAALPRRQGLDRMEGKGRRVRQVAGADLAARPVHAAQRVAGVLDDGRARRPRDPGNAVHVADAPAQVHGQDGLHRPPGAGQRRLQRARGHQAGGRIDVGEHDLRAAQTRGRRRGEKGHGRDDAEIALAHVQGPQRQVQGRRAAGGGRGGRRADLPGQRRLEFSDLGTMRQALAAQHVHDRGDVRLVDRLAAVRQRRQALFLRCLGDDWSRNHEGEPATARP